jgi:type I restriction enzyme S subunit
MSRGRRTSASVTPPGKPVPPASSTELPEGFKMTELGPLPEEWEAAQLHLLGQICAGGPAPQGSQYFGGTHPFVRVQHLEEEGYEVQRWDLITDEAVRRYRLRLFPAGTIVFPKSGASIRLEKRAVLARASYLVSHLCAIVPNNDVVDGDFLFFALRSIPLAAEKAEGYPTLSLTEIRQRCVPLPPMCEQRAIAHVLRTVQRAKEATERVVGALKELKKSLMQHLFTYGPVPVTERERVPLQETEIGPLPAHWRVVRLGEVVDVKGGKRLPKGDEFASNPTPYPYIRIVDFKNGSVDIRNLKFLTEEQHIRLNRYIITSNDVYISIAGTIGLVGSVPEELNGAHLTENAARLILNTNRLYRQFLVVALQSDMVQAQIQARATKTSQPKLALARIKEIPIPLPLLDEQREIARMLQAVDAKIAAEQARRAALEELFKTVLHILMTAKLRVPYEGARHA